MKCPLCLQQLLPPDKEFDYYGKIEICPKTIVLPNGNHVHHYENNSNLNKIVIYFDNYRVTLQYGETYISVWNEKRNHYSKILKMNIYIKLKEEIKFIEYIKTLVVLS
ncbi:hypothetical protein UFOVP1290_124 [uncultured Caudovirales phage]|uniref:Uncharacterized protein n=1 Tax=uncultured Caudovirales phage TaxID=2100421 RepID=A0A6J5RX74_9CAUD|nr:hypothetical protein UFOVP1290_124 [uncultured Caudovirales phage]